MRQRNLRVLARVFNDAFGGVLDLERVEHGLKQVYTADTKALRECARDQVKGRMLENVAAPLFRDIEREYAVSRDDLIAHVRVPYLIRARRDLMSRLRDQGMSLGQIGALVDRDHSTVFYGIKAWLSAPRCDAPVVRLVAGASS